jgi:hypothetical protein
MGCPAPRALQLIEQAMAGEDAAFRARPGLPEPGTSQELGRHRRCLTVART